MFIEINITPVIKILNVLNFGVLGKSKLRTKPIEILFSRFVLKRGTSLPKRNPESHRANYEFGMTD
jgi:hypothetical protein